MAQKQIQSNTQKNLHDAIVRDNWFIDSMGPKSPLYEFLLSAHFARTSNTRSCSRNIYFHSFIVIILPSKQKPRNKWKTRHICTSAFIVLNTKPSFWCICALCDKRPIFTFLTFLIVGATFSAAWTGNCRVLCLLLLRFGCRFVTIAFAVDAAHSKSIYREKLNYNG